MLISVNGEHSNLLECRRKTELIGVLLKHNPSVRIQFADTFNVTLKGGKTCVVKFIRDPQGGDGKVKGTKVSVAPGLPPSSGTPPQHLSFLIFFISKTKLKTKTISTSISV
jgi:hypothetical protein